MYIWCRLGLEGLGVQVLEDRGQVRLLDQLLRELLGRDLRPQEGVYVYYDLLFMYIINVLTSSTFDII